jgi:hypothetical protein
MNYARIILNLFLFVFTIIVFIFASMKRIKKQRKQKYPFKTIAINGTFKIMSAEYNSMMTAWRQHNGTYPELAIDIESEDLSSNEMLITRVK